MKDEIALSECGQYITINTEACQDLKLLQSLFNKVQSVQGGHQNRCLIINLHDWLSDTSNMDDILSIADVFSLFEHHGWRIAIVVSQLNQKTLMLENLLDFKGVDLQHFAGLEEAQRWLLK